MASLPLATRISQSSQRTVSQNVITANYGDNNTQIAAWGVNSMKEEWQLEWTGLNQTDRNTLMNFWESHGLAVAFYWAAPGGKTGAWRFVDSMSETSSGWFYNISTKVRYYPDATAVP